jgi:hypothetical protein
MGWETRNGRGHYYIRTTRQGGRIVREYFGTGELGEIAATFDEFARAERVLRAKHAAQVAASSMKVDQLIKLDKLVAAYVKTVEVAAHQALSAAGYRRHERGEWRKTRGQA